MMPGLAGDVRHGIRQLLANRSFTLPAIAGLALSLGAATAVFSVVHTMLLRSLGFKAVGQIVTLWQTEPRRGQQHVEVCLDDLRLWSGLTGVFEGVALASSVNLDVPLFDGGEPQQVDMTTVSGSFFHVLGAKPAAGRLLAEEDDQPGAPLRLVISHRLWVAKYAGNPGVIGRQIRSGGSTATVVGVTSADFDFPRDTDLFAPLHAAWPDVEKQPYFRVFRSVARLRTGVTPETAKAQLDVAAAPRARTRPSGSPEYRVLVTPILDEMYGSARAAVWILLGAVCLVLLIACANVANLLLARATVRQRELALRAVLGATRRRMVAQLMAEALLLGSVAAVAGLLLSWFGVALLARLAPPEVPRLDGVALDGPILLFGVALSFATVLLFGLGPAILASRRDPNDLLHQGGRSLSADRKHTGARRILIGAEVALSVILLVGAGLLVRSFQAYASLNPGFSADHVLTFRITTNTGSQEKRRALYTGVLRRLRSLPGVTSAGAVLLRPLSGMVGWDTVYTVEGQSPEQQAANPNGNYEAISPQYFGTMGMRVIAGRDVADSDTETAPGVVIVNESTARRHWPNETAVGRHVRLSKDPKAPWLTVVGVVNDVRYREWEAVRPDFYVPYTQRAQHRSDFVVKTAGDPAELTAAVRREVFAIDPNQPISNVTTMSKLADAAIARSRFTAAVLAGLAACALALAALGVYGLLAYTVAQRTTEIGIRMALGATRRQILGLVSVSGMRIAIAGAVAGLAVAFILIRYLRSQLYGVGAFDAVSWIGAAAALLVVAGAACVVPAWRAAAVEPARALARD